MKKPIRNRIKAYDDCAREIAILFNVTDDYIRKIVADTKHQRYKGEKPQAIRKAYIKYKQSKQRIIQNLQQNIQAA